MKKSEKVVQFRIGDTVTWKSQAGGSLTTKTGVVIEIVPAGKVPKTFKSTATRKHESYVIEVSFNQKQLHSPGKPIRDRKPERYWPLVSNLRLVKRAGFFQDDPIGPLEDLKTDHLPVQILKTPPDMQWSDIPKVKEPDWLDTAANASSPENHN